VKKFVIVGNRRTDKASIVVIRKISNFVSFLVKAWLLQLVTMDQKTRESKLAVEGSEMCFAYAKPPVGDDFV
jgi:hypothetical protein